MGKNSLIKKDHRLQRGQPAPCSHQFMHHHTDFKPFISDRQIPSGYGKE